jgi:hypothetical protein
VRGIFARERGTLKDLSPFAVPGIPSPRHSTTPSQHHSAPNILVAAGYHAD